MRTARVVVLVPRRADNGRRDQLWRWCDQWWRQFVDWPIFEGHHHDGPFNRSRAINAAAARAGDWEVAVIADADVMIGAGQVADGIEIAQRTGKLVIPFTRYRWLSPQGSDRIMAGDRNSWLPFVERTMRDSCSGCVVVPRPLWDAVAGFDQRFVGWGWEDVAFAFSCEALAGERAFVDGDIWHLWHAPSPEQDESRPTFRANKALMRAYRRGIDDRVALQSLIEPRRSDLSDHRSASAVGIPRRIVRSVPAETSDEVEAWWTQAGGLHPGWEMVTLRDPIDPVGFPLTAPHWDRCTSGAQRAGLIRLETIWQHGGIWIDSDVELYRPLNPLLGSMVFAAWEDTEVVPDAVFGAVPAHPAIRRCLALAIERLGQGAWASGPGVFTEVLPETDDALLLPPGSFYPYHYREKSRRNDDHRSLPWCFGAHHWHGSWLR